MDETNSLIEQRKAKLAALQAKGINPFANKFTPTETCDGARSNYVENREVAIAGRITAHREMGKSIFIDVRDQSGRVQVYAQKQALGDEQFDIFKHLDLGDFIGVIGTMFTTKTGEPSVKMASFVILAKALRPPPGKWHGLEDTEIRYRQRYLDLMANEEVKNTFLKRSAVVREIRNFFHSRGYVEVETPMMQNIPGGAAAAPFVTKHNALNCNFYLRIAIELYHKRLLVGGIDKIFEIGKNFRNEGLSRKHNPEFTMLEAYQAYGDYETMMELVESLVTHVAEKALGTLIILHADKSEAIGILQTLLNNLDKFATETNSKGVESSHLGALTELREWLKDIIAQSREEPFNDWVQRANVYLSEQIRAQYFIIADSLNWKLTEWSLKSFDQISNNYKNAINRFDALSKSKKIDLKRPWRRVRYKDLVREKAGADWFEISPEARKERAVTLGAEIGKEYEDFEVTGAIFEKLIEPTLIQPTFVTHLPKELVPLAKLSPDDPSTVEVFECCINGQEVAPAYSEQNDPVEQRERLEHQAGGEQQKLDEDFLVALEHGMPPAGGMGMGIDRLCMMLLGQESIRDVILFPQMKPK
ncbi:MAG TPA: lysine--tRNA ligase [Verrucomicrobiae bacterium]|jgi:lysyl-tRNA synthetase class 2|nr:lysine--tRNA ligase [Verrucomicrobiae bacterium]